VREAEGVDIDATLAAMEIDWKLAPKNARWWAMDANGTAHWFVAPNVAAFTEFWFSEPLPAPSFGFLGDWKQSLVERPV
jgi:hypothetical protein